MTFNLTIVALKGLSLLVIEMYNSITQAEKSEQVLCLQIRCLKKGLIQHVSHQLSGQNTSKLPNCLHALHCMTSVVSPCPALI